MAKQLFNSSEKSNFILNLTEEKYAKIASWGLLAACFCTSAATAIPVFTGNKAYTITSMGLSIAGVLGMVLALIGAMKKYVTKRIIVPLCCMGVTLVLAVISLINSYDISVSLNGYPGRGEGLLAIIFYICFFISAASIKVDKARETLIYGILGNGLLNCVIGFIQVFTGKISDFVIVQLKTVEGNVEAVKINAAAGLSQSPLFLAMVLSISIAAALMGAVLLNGKKKRIFCIISACVFSFVIMFTYSLIGICGAGLAVIAAVITVFAVKAPKINLLSVFTVIVPAALAVVIVQAGVVGNISQYRLYDGRILWYADSYMRLVSSGDSDSNVVDVDDTIDVYYTLNRKTMDIITKYPFLGTGPDQLLYPQIYTYGPYTEGSVAVDDIIMYNKGTFDKVYNEYLNTAATKGVPSAILLAVTLLSVLFIGFKGYKKSRNGMTLCMTMLTAMGVLIFFIGCSNTAFSPIFWAIAGSSTALVKKD